MGIRTPQRNKDREAMGFDERSNRDESRAQLKCSLALSCDGAQGGRKEAPKGDYVLTRMSDALLGFRPVAGAGAFQLSIDAVAQHVAEGRMTIDGALPKKLG